MLVSTNMDADRSSIITDIALITEDMRNRVAVPPGNDTLVRTAASENDGLLSDEMGPEVVQVLVGTEKEVFTVHKNLLLATGESFVNAFDPKKNQKGRITMSTKSADVFKLFVDMIYTRRVPAFTSVMTEEVKVLRLRGLCQLYLFAEELKLKHIIRNRIFDRIQDGFFLLDKMPDVSFISSIYRNTPASSQLRKFIAACLVHQISLRTFWQWFTTLYLDKTQGMVDRIQKSPWIANLYRVRNCEGRPGCVECMDRDTNVVRPPGVWPCVFHVHTDVEGMESGENDVACHLWQK